MPSSLNALVSATSARMSLLVASKPSMPITVVMPARVSWLVCSSGARLAKPRPPPPPSTCT